MGVITVAINIQNLDQVKNATGDTFFSITLQYELKYQTEIYCY